MEKRPFTVGVEKTDLFSIFITYRHCVHLSIHFKLCENCVVVLTVFCCFWYFFALNFIHLGNLWTYAACGQLVSIDNSQYSRFDHVDVGRQKCVKICVLVDCCVCIYFQQSEQNLQERNKQFNAPNADTWQNKVHRKTIGNGRFARKFTHHAIVRPAILFVYEWRLWSWRERN